MMNSSLIPMFFNRATTEPDRPYLFSRGRSIGYAQVCSMARRLAHFIRNQRESVDVIAVSTDSPEALLYTIWACLCSGTTLVLCPGLTSSDDMRAIMIGSGARVLFTDAVREAGNDWAISLTDTLRLLAEDTSPIDALSEPHPTGETAGGFVFLTSGTAGEPKWVHCGFQQSVDVVECMWNAGALDHAREQVVYLTQPLFHSYGLSSLLEYTRAGAEIVLPSGSSPLGPIGELNNRELAARVTAIEGVPYLYVQLMRLGGRIRLPSLKHVGFGGGPLDLEVVPWLRAHYPEVTCSVRYGLTETPSVVSHKVFSPLYDADWRNSGRILPIYRVEIVGASGETLGPDCEGEIVVRGSCVADYGTVRQDATERILRTGDLGYMTRGGELVIVGRRSAFLKYRGFRLSPEQIESVIRSFPGIDDCRVFVQDSRLLADVVSQNGSMSKSQLLKYLVTRLPKYAVPEDVIAVDSIPRTASGKIKRDSL